MYWLLLYLLLGILAPAANASRPTGKTRNGTYYGRYIEEFDQDVFLGIPYANAPRLERPQPLEDSWTGSRPATANGNACYQPAAPQLLELLNVTLGEDCLNLNIIRPSGYSQNASLPVVVWLYGGGFALGTNADSNTNTSYVIQASVEKGTPIMSVVINYRIGFFGFPGGYSATAAGVTNLGLRDQRLALAWIQENIAGFGGDPNKVTLWGQSAGGGSIGYQLLGFNGVGAEKLFRGGIMVSSSQLGSNMLFSTHPHTIEGYEKILNGTGCNTADNTLQCVKEAPAELILELSATAPLPTWWPHIDGDFLVEPPSWQLRKGRFSSEISLLVGANNDEGLISAAYFGPDVETEEDLEVLMRQLFPAARDTTIQEVLEAYPIDAPSPPYSLPMGDDRFCGALHDVNMTCGAQYRRIAAIVGDYAQISGRRIQAQDYSDAGNKVYSYRFDTTPTSIPIALNGIAPGFATHSAEYAYFFGFPTDYNMFNMNPTVVNVSSHLALSSGIVDKLVAYIASGDPNSIEVPGFPDWPLYSVEKPQNMVFNATEADDKLNVHIEPDTWRKSGMALWDKYSVELQFGGNWRP